MNTIPPDLKAIAVTQPPRPAPVSVSANSHFSNTPSPLC